MMGSAHPSSPCCLASPKLYCDPGLLSTDKVPVVGPHCSWGTSSLL